MHATLHVTSVEVADHPNSVEHPASTRTISLRPRRLVGRYREVAEVTESVLSSSVTTLIGPGGVGKTARYDGSGVPSTFPMASSRCGSAHCDLPAWWTR
jgi:hypothetical protein